MWITDTIEAQSPPSIDVFLLAGQSNAAYTFRADAAESGPVIPHGHGFYFGSSESPVSYSEWDSDAAYSVYDMTEPSGRAHIGGIEQPFAATYYKSTGHNICIINVAIGGSKIVQWYPGEEYYIWAQEVFSKAVDALADKFTIIPKGMIWMQGESNPTWPIEAYQNRFMTTLNSMSHESSSHGYFNEDYALNNCIISLTRQHRGQNTCIAQIQLAATYDNVELGCIVCDLFNPENGLLYNDDTHYTQKGRNIVGVDLARAYVKYFT